MKTKILTGWQIVLIAFMLFLVATQYITENPSVNKKYIDAMLDNQHHPKVRSDTMIVILNRQKKYQDYILEMKLDIDSLKSEKK